MPSVQPAGDVSSKERSLRAQERQVRSEGSQAVPSGEEEDEDGGYIYAKEKRENIQYIQIRSHSSRDFPYPFNPVLISDPNPMSATSTLSDGGREALGLPNSQCPALLPREAAGVKVQFEFVKAPLQPLQ